MADNEQDSESKHPLVAKETEYNNLDESQSQATSPASPSISLNTLSSVAEKKEEKKELKLDSPRGEIKFDENRGTAASGFEAGILPPDIFPGVKRCETKLVYIDNPSSATLQTKLDTLGTQGFRVLPAIRAYSLGRAVVGWDYFLLPRGFWKRVFSCKEKKKDDPKLCDGAHESELVMLPNLFSRGYAYINVYLRFMLSLILLISIIGFAVSESGVGISANELNKCTMSVMDYNTTLDEDWGGPYDPIYNPITDPSIATDYCTETLKKSSSLGQAWAVGTIIALSTYWIMGHYTSSAIGTIPFLRAMGKPEVEEYMFSYSWWKNPNEIRTLAKALWQNDVGCWIDVVKLNSGDAIRPVVRTMMQRVYRCVIFLSKAYLGSPNCCVEIQEAIKHPDKITFCLLEPIPEVQAYLAFLSKDHRKLKICNGITELIRILEKEITSPDPDAYAWWKTQKITISGAPERLLARKPIPMFQLWGKSRPRVSLHVGPLFIAGDCQDAGSSFLPPYLFIAALFAVGFNFIDIFQTLNSKKKREPYVYVLLVAICLTILAPFFELKKLLDTRFWMHPVLKPLLASSSLSSPIKVIVKGNANDPICSNLRLFLHSMGHGVADEHKEYEKSDAAELNLIKDHITILVIDSIAARDKYLSGDEAHLGKVMQNSVVVYSGNDNPFGDGTKIASQLMRYLVLSKNECKDTLAENVFSGVAIRAVKYLHHGHEELV